MILREHVDRPEPVDPFGSHFGRSRLRQPVEVGGMSGMAEAGPQWAADR
jgi:hypothetical protein